MLRPLLSRCLSVAVSSRLKSILEDSPPQTAELAKMLLPRAAAAGLASIIVPLYQYPPSETACWPDITAALKSAPKSTPWIFIANPNSGPVSDTSELYLRCLPSLRAVKNSPPVSIVGYVPTGYGKNPTAQVTQQVALYSRWNTFVVDPVGTPSKKKTALKVDGIFFDEVPDTPDSLGVYQMYAANARGARWAPSKKGMVRVASGTRVLYAHQRDGRSSSTLARLRTRATTLCVLTSRLARLR